jgi:regulator of sirC expression with transglutaminase-like and TPR domain
VSEDTRARFAARVATPNPDLAEVNLLIAAEAYPSLDIPRWLDRVEELAEEADRQGGGVGGIAVALREADLRGDRSTYDDPRNSFLNDVLDRRVGLPIALSALTVAVGRRIGVPLACVGMPGHVIVADIGSVELRFIDPFDDWSRRTVEECQQIVLATAGVDLPAEQLVPTPPHQIIRRMLVNLMGSYFRREMYPEVRWTLELQAILVPGDEDIAAQLRAVDGLT